MSKNKIIWVPMSNSSSFSIKPRNQSVRNRHPNIVSTSSRPIKKDLDSFKLTPKKVNRLGRNDNQTISKPFNQIEQVSEILPDNFPDPKVFVGNHRSQDNNIDFSTSISSSSSSVSTSSSSVSTSSSSVSTSTPFVSTFSTSFPTSFSIVSTSFSGISPANTKILDNIITDIASDFGIITERNEDDLTTIYDLANTERMIPLEYDRNNQISIQEISETKSVIEDPVETKVENLVETVESPFETKVEDLVEAPIESVEAPIESVESPVQTKVEAVEAPIEIKADENPKISGCQIYGNDIICIEENNTSKDNIIANLIEIVSTAKNEEERIEMINQRYKSYEIETVMKLYHENFTSLKKPQRIIRRRIMVVENKSTNSEKDDKLSEEIKSTVSEQPDEKVTAKVEKVEKVTEKLEKVETTVKQIAPRRIIRRRNLS